MVQIYFAITMLGSITACFSEERNYRTCADSSASCVKQASGITAGAIDESHSHYFVTNFTPTQLREYVATSIDYSTVDSRGQTFLHWSAAKGNTTTMAFVLQQDAVDVNKQDNDGNTPLHIAALHGGGESIQLLLSQPDIDKSLQNNSGETAHDIAINSGRDEIASMLDP